MLTVRLFWFVVATHETAVVLIERRVDILERRSSCGEHEATLPSKHRFGI